MQKLQLGRHVYGIAAIGFGIISFTWRDLAGPWQQAQVFGNTSHHEIFVYIAAAIELLGGLAIQWRKTARAGAILLATIFSIFALLWIPRAIAAPRVYDGYGNFFEQLSIVSGGLIMCVLFSGSPKRAAWLARLAYYFFATCVISFMLVQLFSFSAVVSFTPKWIPPSQKFWAVVTTISFPLAAIALFTGRAALLASRLLTAMIIGFGLFVWLPRPFADPHQLFNWGGNAQNLAIGGAAWILADYLAEKRRAVPEPSPATASVGGTFVSAMFH